MKYLKRISAAVLMLLSFFTTVLCMKDVLSVRDEMQNAEHQKAKN